MKQDKKMITVKIATFGAIERRLPQDFSLPCPAGSSVAAVLEDVARAYPEAYGMLERCACAVGEDIIPRQTALTQDSTLVLLSPVAGG